MGRKPAPVQPLASSSRGGPVETSDRVTLSRADDYADLFGLHTLQAYPENGGPQLERAQQLSSGGKWMTEAASLKSISNANDPVSRQRREALLDTIGWAHAHGMKMNVRLDYDWGQNVPQDEAGRREYASMMRDFVRDARARTGGDDTVANWVVGNEPNLAHENGGRALPPQDYVAAVKSVRQALDADPATRSANLASAGLSPGGSDPHQYFAGMLKAGIGDAVGTYGVHEYADRLDNLDRYDQLAQQYGAAHPLAITEFGIPRRGINEQQQAAQTVDFVQQIARRNETSGKSQVQNVTLWKANRGPGEEAFSLTPEMLQSLSRMGHQSVDTRPLEDTYRGLFAPDSPAAVNGGSPASANGTYPAGGNVAGGNVTSASPPNGVAAPASSVGISPDQKLQDQSREVLRQLEGEAADGPPPAARRLSQDYQQALEKAADLKPQTHQQVGQALQAAGLPNPTAQGAGPDAAAQGAGPSAAPAQSAPPSPVSGPPSPSTAAAVTSPQRSAASNAPLPSPDPNKPFAVSHILENRDPRLPDNPPGIEGFIKDKNGKPIDARGLTVRFDGGAEPYYIPIVDKPEKGPGYFEVPLIVPGGFKGRYNVAVGRKDGDNFTPLSNTANVEVTRDHRRTQVDFQAQG